MIARVRLHPRRGPGVRRVTFWRYGVTVWLGRVFGVLCFGRSMTRRSSVVFEGETLPTEHTLEYRP